MAITTRMIIMTLLCEIFTLIPPDFNCNALTTLPHAGDS
jgi:hypothetical protein